MKYYRDELLSVEEVAEELSIHPAIVRELIHTGAIIASRFGQGRKVRRSQLNQYIEKQFNEH